MDVQVKLRKKHKNKSAVCVTCYRYKEKQVFKIQMLQIIIGSTALTVVGDYIKSTCEGQLWKFPLLIYLHKEICRYLETLKKIIEGYLCSDDLKIETWVCNPFLADTDSKSMIGPCQKWPHWLQDKEMMLHEFYSTAQNIQLFLDWGLS